MLIAFFYLDIIFSTYLYTALKYKFTFVVCVCFKLLKQSAIAKLYHPLLVYIHVYPLNLRFKKVRLRSNRRQTKLERVYINYYATFINFIIRYDFKCLIFDRRLIN